MKGYSVLDSCQMLYVVLMKVSNAVGMPSFTFLDALHVALMKVFNNVGVASFTLLYAPCSFDEDVVLLDGCQMLCVALMKVSNNVGMASFTLLMLRVALMKV
jgi:hypothetical protein